MYCLTSLHPCIDVIDHQDGFDVRSIKFVVKNSGVVKSKDTAHHYVASLRAMTSPDEFRTLLPTLEKELKAVWKHVAKEMAL